MYFSESVDRTLVAEVNVSQRSSVSPNSSTTVPNVFVTDCDDEAEPYWKIMVNTSPSLSSLKFNDYPANSFLIHWTEWFATKASRLTQFFDTNFGACLLQVEFCFFLHVSTYFGVWLEFRGKHMKLFFTLNKEKWKNSLKTGKFDFYFVLRDITLFLIFIATFDEPEKINHPIGKYDNPRNICFNRKILTKGFPSNCAQNSRTACMVDESNWFRIWFFSENLHVDDFLLIFSRFSQKCSVENFFSLP